MNIALIFFLSLLSVTRVFANSPMVTSPAEENDILRMCKRSDVIGYWNMEDQIFAKSFEQSPEGQQKIQSKSKYFSYQFLAFEKNGSAKDVIQKGYTDAGEQKARTESKDFAKNMKYLKSSTSEMTFAVNERGFLLWKKKGEVTSVAVCNVVKERFGFFDHPSQANPGDLLLGVLELHASGTSDTITSIQLFKPAKPQ
jgi:hypothetical protein